MSIFCLCVQRAISRENYATRNNCEKGKNHEVKGRERETPERACIDCTDRNEEGWNGLEGKRHGKRCGERERSHSVGERFSVPCHSRLEQGLVESSREFSH